MMKKNIFSVKVMKNVKTEKLDISKFFSKIYLFFFLLVKNRHHVALFIQNGYLKLTIRQGPTASNDKSNYTSVWMWQALQINDDQWHSYKIFVNYPEKVKDSSFFPGKK